MKTALSMLIRFTVIASFFTLVLTACSSGSSDVLYDDTYEPETPPDAATEVDEEPSSPQRLPESIYAPSASGSQKYALLVGIGDYPGVENDLDELPVTDVGHVKDALIQNLGFQEQNVVTILDADADWKNIIDTFKAHLGQAGPNDVAFFYYSGHGTQLDFNAFIEDYEPDGRDEGIVVWDVDADPDNLDDFQIILDDHLNQLADYLVTQNVLFVMDSCHSGTITRGGDFTSRYLDYEKLKKAFASKNTNLLESEEWNQEADGYLEQPANHILLAAASPEQSSWQTPYLGSSVFSYYFVEYLANLDSEATFNDLIETVGSRTSIFTLFFLDEEQTPQAEGARLSESIYNFLHVNK